MTKARSAATAIAAAVLLGFALEGVAQQDIDGSGDHPEIPRVAGSYIVYQDVVDFDRLTVPVGPLEGDDFAATESLEGEVRHLSYVFESADVATLRVKRNYERALQERGFEILYKGSTSELSSGDGRSFFLRSGLFDRGARDCCRIANRDRQVRYLAARSDDGSVLAAIAIFNARRVDGPAVSKAIVTAEAMDERMAHEPLSAQAMRDGIVEDGRVAVRDILFASDSAEILSESAEALERIAGLMAENSGMSLLVVGHTDNRGDYDYNLSLSLQRAQSVVDWLTEEGSVDRGRLQAAGAGMMAPVTTNRTPQGRAQNRRVELVERGS